MLQIIVVVPDLADQEIMTSINLYLSTLENYGRFRSPGSLNSYHNIVYRIARKLPGLCWINGLFVHVRGQLISQPRIQSNIFFVKR